MDKNIVKKVKERSQGLCEICYGAGAHLHHSVSGRGKRKEHETVESVYHLCLKCHELVHNNRAYDLLLKFTTQNRYKNLSEEELREKMGGRIYGKGDIYKVTEDEEVANWVERGLIT